MTAEFTVAVHAVAYLAKHVGSTITSEALAANICTNPARVRKVMAKLKRSGLIASREGKGNGGYSALQQSEDITLGCIIRALDVHAVPKGWRSGGMDMDCMIASGMADVMDAVCDELDGLCKERLDTITVADIIRRLAERKSG